MENSISLQVEVKVESAIKQFEALAIAAERAAAALEKLGDAKHGGVHVRAVGEIVKIEILPAG